jgi:hypothetical protein
VPAACRPGRVVACVPPRVGRLASSGSASRVLGVRAAVQDVNAFEGTRTGDERRPLTWPLVHCERANHSVQMARKLGAWSCVQRARDPAGRVDRGDREQLAAGLDRGSAARARRSDRGPGRHVHHQHPDDRPHPGRVAGETRPRKVGSYKSLIAAQRAAERFREQNGERLLRKALAKIDS